MKHSDIFSDFLKNLPKSYQFLSDIILKERDFCLAYQLQLATQSLYHAKKIGIAEKPESKNNADSGIPKESQDIAPAALNTDTPLKQIEAGIGPELKKASTEKFRILCVLGAAHLPGTQQQLQSETLATQEAHDRFKAYQQIPSRISFKKLFSWISLGLVVSALSFFVWNRSLSSSDWQELGLAWILCRCIGSGLGV